MRLPKWLAKIKKQFGWLLFASGSLVAGFGYVMDIQQITALGWSNQVWQFIGFILMVTAVALLLLQYEHRNKVAPQIASPPMPQPLIKRPHLIYDNVRWEDIGNDGYGNIEVDGPFCPSDLTRLGLNQQDKFETDLKWDADIGQDYYGRFIWLECPECHERYNLGVKSKIISNSRNEVTLKFEGMRRRAHDRLD